MARYIGVVYLGPSRTMRCIQVSGVSDIVCMWLLLTVRGNCSKLFFKVGGIIIAREIIPILGCSKVHVLWTCRHAYT